MKDIENIYFSGVQRKKNNVFGYTFKYVERLVKP